MARVGRLASRDIDALWNALRPRIIGLGTGATTRIGAQGPAGPKGVNWRGEWAAETDYEQGDLVYLDTAGGGANELVTYYALDDHTSIPAEPPAPGGTTHWWEIGNAYLIIDGSRVMTGDLNHGHYSIVDAHDADIEGTATVGEDVVFTEGIGGAIVSNPRTIHMTGDHVDDEAKVDGLERVVFNNEPTASSIESPSRIEMNTGVTPGTSYTAGEGKGSWSALETAFGWYVASGAGLFFVAFGWWVKMGAPAP